MPVVLISLDSTFSLLFCNRFFWGSGLSLYGYHYQFYSFIKSVFSFICKMFPYTFFFCVCEVLELSEVSESVSCVALFVSTFTV